MNNRCDRSADMLLLDMSVELYELDDEGMYDNGISNERVQPFESRKPDGWSAEQQRFLGICFIRCSE